MVGSDAALTRNLVLKTARVSALRISPELRTAAKSVLHEGETLTKFVETALRECVQRRSAQDEFLARGLAASEAARQTGRYQPASVVHAELQQRLITRRKQVLG
ncbi:MAG: YlcI/YnfO family protein [Burkholderiales bacterium]